MDLSDHNNQLLAEKKWPFEGEGEVQSECCAAESFKYLFSRARLGSSISSSVVETSTIPVMLSTWGGASEVMCSLASWFTIGPHVACLKDLQSRDAEVADIDSYFSSAGGQLAHRVGVYEFDKDRPGGMQTGAYIKSDAFDVRVLKVEKDGKGSSKAADRALMHSGGDHAGMVQDAQMHSLQGVRQEMVNHCTANEKGARCVALRFNYHMYGMSKPTCTGVYCGMGSLIVEVKTPGSEWTRKLPAPSPPLPYAALRCLTLPYDAVMNSSHALISLPQLSPRSPHITPHYSSPNRSSCCALSHFLLALTRTRLDRSRPPQCQGSLLRQGTRGTSGTRQG